MPLSRHQRIARIVASLQDITGATRNELIVVTALLAGLLGGVLYSFFTGTDIRSGSAHTSLSHILDSLAAVEQTTFTGSTPEAEPVEMLARGDTLRRQSSFVPASAGRRKQEKISSGKIHLNSATQQELMRLPGVGEATAKKIIALRKERPLQRIEDIMRVRGIGKKKFEAMREFLAL